MKIAERIKYILKSPSSEWVEIKNEDIPIMDLFIKYALILALIPAVCAMSGYLLFGIYLKETKHEILPSSAALWAGVSYLQNIFAVLLSGFVIDGLARAFRAEKDLNASMKVIVFSFTPVWLSGIIYLVPAANFLVAAGWIYMMVLMYKGLNIVKNVPRERVIGYEVLIYCVMMVLYYFMNFVLGYGKFLIFGY